MRNMKTILLALLVSATSASPIFETTVIDKDSAPLLSSTTAVEKEIPHSYMVVFKDHVKDEHADQHHDWVASQHASSLRKRDQSTFTTEGLFHDVWDTLTGVNHKYRLGNLKGYSGKFSPDVVELIRKHPDVEYVEIDSEVHTMEKKHKKSHDGDKDTEITQKSAPWGLARLSHRSSLSFGTFNKYLYDSNGGSGVTAYVIDTGVNYKHADFEGRARWGKTIPDNDEDADGNGHGSHCAGTIAGRRFGVAKNANVVGVKVLRSSGSGSMSDVVKGVEYAAEAHIEELRQAKKKNKKFRGSTANMSLGGGKSRTLDLAVNAAVEAGLHFAVAAGNDNSDACNYSPAGAENAVTVGATDVGDARASFSNKGKCVDIFAPGVNIQSVWTGGNHTVNTISGTSMASPHMCGLLTYLLSLQPERKSGFYTPLSPKKLKQLVLDLGTPGTLSDVDAQTINLLAFNGVGTNVTSIIGELMEDDAQST